MPVHGTEPLECIGDYVHPFTSAISFTITQMAASEGEIIRKIMSKQECMIHYGGICNEDDAINHALLL